MAAFIIHKHATQIDHEARTLRFSCSDDDEYRMIGVSPINALHIQRKISLLVRGRIAWKIQMLSCARNHTYQHICLLFTQLP
ncbi:hypothetical protein SAMN03159511_3866 [Pseudomonas sp. NFACC19-2]|nr:hypothetical protein SAMN03159511_3866 [Pseudomonas sp. NFACC19-2]